MSIIEDRAPDVLETARQATESARMRADRTTAVGQPSATSETNVNPSVTTAARRRLLMRNRELRRLVAFLFAGGISALCTIGITRLLNLSAHQTYALAALIGTEVGILVNFSINDRLAFYDLAGHRRPLLTRLFRYHLTCATGQTLIFLIAVALHDLAHWDGSLAQAVPIVLVTGVNFALHRFWTYRGARGS